MVQYLKDLLGMQMGKVPVWVVFDETRTNDSYTLTAVDASGVVIVRKEHGGPGIAVPWQAIKSITPE